MLPHPDETTLFRYIRTLDGRLEPVDVARRNGKAVPQFPPSTIDPLANASADPSELDELVAEVTQNLTETERRTFLKILDSRSILDIAAEERVSRAAVYARIRSMVVKNDYVAIWWKRRQEQESGYAR
jgi:hypothetical protein